ncbi:winged helix-turn-helix transcriptional regulator [Streptomyces roseirectus]|uniref:Winged helix-turn-helix transcriptional regulator n=1 Tax=Streptomyces roseirectus TaxID=2768066 RepID=A0A7H0I875_9ACTN|nr:helix-turn-helix domain-containing protein [Streptomyces roseirectus]QNP68991.1 winged helix-turn-helix transcriptional regulator [Streptomyces roseirectus]
MTLRVHFTADDLSRIRLVREPDPLWETVLSVAVLTTAQGRAVFDPWRAQVRAGLRRLPCAVVRTLRTLAPPVGAFPDFLTPAEASDGLEAGLDAVLSTPRRRLHREVAALPGAPPWTRPLAEGDPQALKELGEALRTYHRAALAPYWPRLRALVDAERALRSRDMLDGGSEALLAGLAPTVRWRPPVLEVDYPVDRDLRLAGRGLVLVPSVFCWRLPISLVDPALPPVLVYPIARPPGWWAAPDHTAGRRGLANLLGPTRAACLRLIEDGCSTGELARRLGMTAPTASQHATVLREAGLTAATRHGNKVFHTLTPLGTALLRTGPGEDARRS